jgi:large subunit ribosomal protein L24
MAFRIRVGDEVEVVRGTRNRNPDKPPTRGRVLTIDREAGRITVEGHNLRTKHVRKSAKHPQGGRLRREAPIAVSNVMVVTADGKRARLSQVARVGGKVVLRDASGGDSQSNEKKD